MGSDVIKEYWTQLLRYKDCVYDRIFNNRGVLLYEGYTKNGFPFGGGTAYYANGNKYREGLFDIKGFIEGCDYYPDGSLCFKGRMHVNRGYGPNYPYSGEWYSPEGELLFSGDFSHRQGGVGYVSVTGPENFSMSHKNAPKINYAGFDINE